MMGRWLRLIGQNARTAGLAATLAILVGGLSGLAYLSLCLYDSALGVCRHPAGFWLAVLAGIGLVGLAVATDLWDRLRRRLRRGMYARPVSGLGGVGLGRSLERAARLVIEGEWEQSGEPSHPIEMDDNLGWRVPLDDGTVVIVFWDDMWQWINDCYIRQNDPEYAGWGATSQRMWDGVIGRPQVVARNWLLEQAGAVRRNKASPNSTRRLVGTPWAIMERIRAHVPPGEIWRERVR
jgi:hypothetical protein